MVNKEQAGRRLKVGVVGLRRGASHVAAFQYNPRAEVTVVCDLDRARAEEVAARYEVPQIASDFEAMVEQPLDIVALATPDYKHGPQIVRALHAGKHVFTEIPAAVEIDQCYALIEASRCTGKYVQMGNQTRWQPPIEAAKHLAAEGAFGEFFYAEGEYFHNTASYMYDAQGRRTWRADNPYAGILGGGPHAYDTIRWLTGAIFVEVHAYSNKKVLVDRVADDFFVALFKAEDGCIAKIAVSSGLQRPYCLYFSLYGTKGTYERSRLQIMGTETSEDYVFLSTVPNLKEMIPLRTYRNVHRRFDGLGPRVPTAGLGHGTADYFAADDLVQAIIQDRPPRIDAYEAARTCAGLRCALESTRTGQPVRIPQF